MTETTVEDFGKTLGCQFQLRYTFGSIGGTSFIYAGGVRNAFRNRQAAGSWVFTLRTAKVGAIVSWSPRVILRVFKNDLAVESTNNKLRCAFRKLNVRANNPTRIKLGTTVEVLIRQAFGFIRNSALPRQAQPQSQFAARAVLVNARETRAADFIRSHRTY